jgi:hypothetical protein
MSQEPICEAPQLKLDSTLPQLPMFNTAKDTWKEIAQGMLTQIQQARNIENASRTVRPFARPDIVTELDTIAGLAQDIEHRVRMLYDAIAADAFAA